MRISTAAAVLAIAAIAAVGCGDDDDGPTVLGTTEATDVPATATADDADMTATTEASTSEAAPPEVDSGAVTIAGTTYEVSGDDFQICETVNPAFATEVNIVVDLPERNAALLVNGDIEDLDPELNGVFLRDADTFVSEQAIDAELSRDGRVLSGSATLEEGSVEFRFEC